MQDILKLKVEDLGFIFIGCELQNSNKSPLLRVYIDFEGGISIDQISQATRHLSSVLDVEHVIQGAYQLEVSSPGVNPPLFAKADYERAIGQTVQVRLIIASNGKKRIKGLLQSVSASEIILNCDDKNVSCSWTDISQGRLIKQNVEVKK